MNTKVFIVYGRDLEARYFLLEMLTEWGLTPLEIDSLPTQGRVLIYSDVDVKTKIHMLATGLFPVLVAKRGIRKHQEALAKDNME